MGLRSISIAAGVVCLLGAAVVPAQAAPECYLTAFSKRLQYRCGSKILNADWDYNGQRDDVFYVSPETDIYRMTRGLSRPVIVSNGKAWTMVDWELRDGTENRRIYAQTKVGRVYWSQSPAGTSSQFGPWYPYIP